MDSTSGDAMLYGHKIGTGVVNTAVDVAKATATRNLKTARGTTSEAKETTSVANPRTELEGLFKKPATAGQGTRD